MQMKTWREKIIRVVGVTVFLLIFVIIYFWMNQIFSRKDSYSKNGAFMKEMNDFDVLFFGTSHMIDGMYPMELWNQYGIFSYNLAGPNNSIAASYWELVNALDYTTPELVVIDCSTLSNKSKILDGKEGQLHRTFDTFPLSINKVKAVYDLAEPEDRMGFLWEFSLYHSRWNQLTEEDFEPEYDTHKGANMLIDVEIPGEKATVDPSEKSSSDTVCVVYLRKMIELCQERNINILLTYIPFPAKEHKLKEANLAYEIAEEYNINFLDFLAMDDIVDFDTDCYDRHSHLNPSGARKVTEYMGAYIQENYDIKDRRDNPAYASWKEDYERYTEHKFELIREQESLDSEFMLHYDKNVSTCIYVKEGSEILQDERMVKLIRNISPYADLEQIDTAIQSKSEYFLVVDNGWCDIWESVGGEHLQDLGTTFGNVSYSSNEGTPLLFIQGSEESFLVEANEEGEMPDVQIVTINKLTGEIVHQSAYVVTGYDDYGNVTANKVE